MATHSTRGHNVPNLFAEVASIARVELGWTRTRVWPATYLLHTATDKVPVMWVKLTRWQRRPEQIRCRAFDGVIRTEWQGGKPSFLRLALSEIRWTFLGVPSPYHCYNVLQSEDDNGIIAAHEVLPFHTFEDWRAQITVHENVYQMRKEHLPPRLKILHTGDKIIAFDGNGEVVTAIVGGKHHARVNILRAVEGVEAVLAFLLVEACQMEWDLNHQD